MADLFGVGSASLGGLTALVTGEVQYWRPAIDTADGYVSPTLTPSIFTRQDSANGSSAAVQLQVSVSDTFVSTVHDSELTQGDNVTGGRQVTGLADGATYFIRVRAKKTLPSGFNYVSPWSATRSFTVVTKFGIATMNVTMNIGVEVTPAQLWAAYVYQNVGVEVTPAQLWAAYVYQNVGAEYTAIDHVPQYVYVGDVTTTTPTPVIWFLRPSFGRPGDGFTVVGFGFGDLQSTFGGVVEYDLGGGNWQSLPIVSWQTFPADPPAYTSARVLDEINGIIDPQHTVIEIIIPPGALPPGYPVRVRTEGP